jgi:hypothetical protein
MAHYILQSYSDAARKEDVLGLIEILTATETSIFNTLGKTNASDMVHINLTDTLATAASNAVAEEADYTNKTLTTPSRVANLVQIIAYPFSVSRTQQEIDHYHGENELARQTAKALKDWHNSAEYDLIHSTLVSAVSGTAPKMNGILNAISQSTNYTAHNSGTVWSASILKGLMKTCWDNSNGDVATDLYMGSFLKDKTDDFTNKTNITYSSGNEKEVVMAVDVFETGFGRVRVHAHRYVSLGSDATARVLAIRPEKLKVAFLRRPYIDTDLARSGDYDARAVVGKLTLEVRNKVSNWHSTGFDKD